MSTIEMPSSDRISSEAHPSATAVRRLRGAPIVPITLALIIGAGLGALTTWARTTHRTVASVNGTPIRQGDFYHRLEVAAGTQVLRQMVAEDMQIQFAQKMGVAPTDAQIDAKMAQARQQPNFKDNLVASHQTEDDIRRGLLVNLSQANAIEKGITVTDADIQAFYKANTDPHNPNARYYRPDTSQVAVIVTPDQTQAQAALHALASGVPFANVARAYSKDNSAANGGLLPPVQRGRMNAAQFPGLEQVIFSLKYGQQTDLVKIANNWWIIRCVGTAPQATVPFDKVKDECREGAMLSKGLAVNGASIQSQIAAFQQAADIKSNTPGYTVTAQAK